MDPIQKLTAIYQYEEPLGYTGYILEIPGICSLPHVQLTFTQYELEQRAQDYFMLRPGPPDFQISGMVFFSPPI
jgi:hypothetical protein